MPRITTVGAEEIKNFLGGIQGPVVIEYRFNGFDKFSHIFNEASEKRNYEGITFVRVEYVTQDLTERSVLYDGKCYVGDDNPPDVRIWRYENDSDDPNDPLVFSEALEVE